MKLTADQLLQAASIVLTGAELLQQHAATGEVTDETWASFNKSLADSEKNWEQAGNES